MVSFIACDGERIVGFASAGPVRDHKELSDGEVYAIYIHRDNYRQGVGRELFCLSAQAWAAKGGRSLMVLFVDQNLRAEAFYRSMGGKHVYHGPHQIAGIDIEDIGYLFDDLAAFTPSPSRG